MRRYRRVLHMLSKLGIGPVFAVQYVIDARAGNPHALDYIRVMRTTWRAH